MREATIVRACLRDGSGGSPTAVLADGPMTDDERRRIPAEMGTSHAVFVAVDGVSDSPSLRFFTSEGELPACGHGTIAALAFLADQTKMRGQQYDVTLHAGGRSFAGSATQEQKQFTATFDPGPVGLRAVTEAEGELVLPALGLRADQLPADACVASVGRERMLIPVPSRTVLAALEPDRERLRAACDRFGLLGCYVYCLPTPEGRLAARMFAPSIGVPEDIANANSTACLAAHLATQGFSAIAVDMGDALGSPATIIARATKTVSGTVVRVGGGAVVEAALQRCQRTLPPALEPVRRRRERRR